MKRLIWLLLFIWLLGLAACGGGEATEEESAVTEPATAEMQPGSQEEIINEAPIAPETVVEEPTLTDEPESAPEPTGPGITAELEITNSQRVEAEGTQLEATIDCFERLFGNGRFVLFEDGSLTYTPSDATALSDCLLLDVAELSGEYESSSEADYDYEIDDIDQFAGLENVEIDVDGTITGTEGTVRFRIFPATGADRSLIQLIRADYLFNGATAVADDDAVSEPETEESPSENEPAPTVMPAVTSALPPINPANFPDGISLASGSTYFVVAEAAAIQYGDAGGGPVTVNFGGASSAIASLCEQIVDGVMLNRPLNEGERDLCQSTGAQVLTFVLGNNSTAVLIHPDNDWATSMTLDELRLAFTTAETWADVNPAWPNSPIQRFLPGTDSGVFNNFVGLLFDGDESGVFSASALNFSEDDNVLLAGAESSVDALVLVNYAFARERGVAATAVAIDGISPNADDYLLNSPALLVTLDIILAQKPQVAAFMNFTLANSRQIAEETGFLLPVDATTQQANEQAWLDAVGE